MKKTHEKSRIYTVTGTAKLKNPEKVVLQIEATGAQQQKAGPQQQKRN